MDTPPRGTPPSARKRGFKLEFTGDGLRESIREKFQ